MNFRVKNMAISEIKFKADKLWEIFEFEGILESLKVIEQITYLLFWRLLDAETLQQHLSVKKIISNKFVFDMDFQKLRWSNITKLSADELYAMFQREISEYIKSQCNPYPEVFKFFSGIQIRIQNPKRLQRAVKLIDEISTSTEFELCCFYEYVISRRKVRDELGRFPTPRNIIRLLVNILDPQQSEIVGDPCCGTGGFLVEVLTHLLEIESNIIGTSERSLTSDNKKSDTIINPIINKVQKFSITRLFGFDNDKMMLCCAFMKLILFGGEFFNLHQENMLGVGESDNLPHQLENYFDVIFAFPALSETIDFENLNPKLFRHFRTKNPNLLYLGLILNMLKVKGRAVLILPTDILSYPSRSFRAIRRQLVEENTLLGILSLGDTIRTYQCQESSVLIFQKGGQTQNIFYYDLSNEIEETKAVQKNISSEGLQKCLRMWLNRDSNQQNDRRADSFFVKASDIADSNYELSYERYKVS